MVKGIKVKEVNKQLYKSLAKLWLFPGAILKHYFVSFLIGEIPSNLNNRNSTPGKTANEIWDMAGLRNEWRLKINDDL